MFGGMQLYSRFYMYIPVAGAPNGANCEAGDFHANLAFSFLDNTQRPITIYTRARVSLLSSCSLEHWPSIIAKNPAVETQFLRWLYPRPGGNGLMFARRHVLAKSAAQSRVFGLCHMKTAFRTQHLTAPSTLVTHSTFSLSCHVQKR